MLIRLDETVHVNVTEVRFHYSYISSLVAHLKEVQAQHMHLALGKVHTYRMYRQ